MSPQFVERFYRGNESFVRRLKLERELEWHNGIPFSSVCAVARTSWNLGGSYILGIFAGCVNTIHFTPSGRTLISGSDDQCIVLGDWQVCISFTLCVIFLHYTRVRLPQASRQGPG